MRADSAVSVTLRSILALSHVEGSPFLASIR